MPNPKIQPAHDAAYVVKKIEHERLLDQATRKTMDGTLGQPTSGDNPGNVSVQVGDNVTNLHRAPATNKLGLLPKLAIAAGLLSVGGGAAVGLSALLGSGATSPPAVAPSFAPGPDSDTLFELHLGEP